MLAIDQIQRGSRWLAGTTDLRTAGEEGFDVDVGVVDFEVVIPEPPGHADGGQNPCLHERGCFSQPFSFMSEFESKCAKSHLFSFSVNQRELQIFIVDGLVRPAHIQNLSSCRDFAKYGIS